VSGQVAGDLVVFGGDVSILSNATIGGDLLVLGGQVVIRGVVGGKVLGYAESVRVDGGVGGDVDIAVGFLTLGDRADISGNVRYRSDRELSRAQNAIVAGDISRTEVLTRPSVDARVLVIPLLVLLFAALSAFLLLRRQLVVTVEHTFAHPARVALVGFAALLLIPIVCVVLLVSVLGSLLGIVLILSYALLLCGAAIGAGAIIGGGIARLLGFTPEPTALSVTLGTLVFYAVMFIPFVGGLFVVAALAIALGALAELLVRAAR